MKSIRKNIFLLLFGAHLCCCPLFANDNLLEPMVPVNNIQTPNNSIFNLANIVDGFLSTEEKTTAPVVKAKTSIRNEFILATEKFNQGNAKSAYDDYDLLIDKIDNDLLALNLARVFYEIGFFSLGDKALNKINSKIKYEKSINDLKRSYKPFKELTNEEEIFFAKQYSNIYFNLSSSETLGELFKFRAQYLRADYYYYTICCANLELKNYSKALNFINKSIGINPKNIKYQLLKTDILMAQEKYSEAKNQLEKLEKDKTIIVLLPQIQIKKQEVLAHLAKKESIKRYHLAYKSFLEGNFEKTKKDCISVLNFDKENALALSLYAKAELALGDVERASTYFINSYKIDKNNFDTLMGLGDVRYIHGDYKNSAKAYNSAYKKDKTNYEAIIKLHNARVQAAKNPKELIRLENLIDKAPDNSYIDYYKSAISIAQKNSVLKEDYLKRAISTNPMFEQAIGQLTNVYLENKNYTQAQNLIYTTSFSLEKNYYYYYLLGLYNEKTGKNKLAIQFYKTSLNLNPNFETANVRLLNLIPTRSFVESEEEEI